MARRVRERLDLELPLLVADLERWTAMDSPSREPGLLDTLAREVAARLTAYGFVVELVERPTGLHVHAVLDGPGRGRVALLCHHDTVFAAGTAARRPFAIDGNRVRGPGVADMKGGLALAAHVGRVLADVGGLARLELVSVPDEEIRSGPFATIDRVAGFDAALCLECGREDGSVVVARKGGAWVEVAAAGRGAHAGVDPDRARNPLLALAHEALRIAPLHATRPGLSVQVTSIQGGGPANAVPDRARMLVDLRADHDADLDHAVEQLSRVRAHDGVGVEVRTLERVPPFDPAPASRRLASIASALGADAGHPIGHARTGGVSDVCWVAWTGVPCLDGLGPVGGLDHTVDEYVALDSFAPRGGVLAGLLASVAEARAT